MTKAPELEHREELKWVLRNIKKELLHAGPDNIVDFNASRLTNSDPDSPSLVAVYKHLKDIERATVIRMVERYDGDGFDVYAYSLDAEAGVTGYKFVVDRDKFETFYHHMVEVKIYMKDLSSDDATDFEEEKRGSAGSLTKKISTSSSRGGDGSNRFWIPFMCSCRRMERTARPCAASIFRKSPIT